MSSAKRALQKVVREWLAGRGQVPELLRRCETCGDTTWRALDPTVSNVQIDVRMPNGARADAVLRDGAGGIHLVIQIDGGSRLTNRVDSRAGLPLIVLRAANLTETPHRWHTVREHGLNGWRCRCAGSRSLPVDDDFSLRVMGCPIHLRNDGAGYYARVIEDCGRCAFFVGIGYAAGDRRRIQLRCGFGAPPAERQPPLAMAPISLGARRQIVAGS